MHVTARLGPAGRQLANEPRADARAEAAAGLRPGTLVKNWVSAMAAYVRSLDGNHMVRCCARCARNRPPSRALTQSRSWQEPMQVPGVPAA